MPTEVISLVIAFVSVVIAFVGALSRAQTDHAKSERRSAEIVTKLDFIGDDIKDMKANYRNIAHELQAVREIAVNAAASASSAHKRLDRAGIDSRE